MTYKSENAHCFRQQDVATRLSVAQQLEHLTGELSWVLLLARFRLFLYIQSLTGFYSE